MVVDNPYARLIENLNSQDFKLLLNAVNERKCREKVGIGTKYEAVNLWRPQPCCVYCGFPDCSRNGKTPAGYQRWYCPSCGYNFSSLTGTVLEYGKKDLYEWERFVTCMCYNASIDLTADMCNIAHSTAFEWRHRIFATIDNYQSHLILNGQVWIDEIYLTDSEIVHSIDYEVKRGLSKNKICIALAIDSYKNTVAIICGHGKPTSKRIMDALYHHIAPGSTIIHDKEKAHNSLIKKLHCIDRSYKADVNNGDYLEAMRLMNNLCAWLRRYLSRFPGMKKSNLQSYLNWFVYLYRIYRDEEKWPKTERVLRHLLTTKTYYRS